jgi:hypothetical protein
VVRSIKRSLPRRQPPCLRVGQRGSRARVVRVKAMEGAKSLECSPEEPPGVWGSERSEGGGGNWGGPPRPGGLRKLPSERRAL